MVASCKIDTNALITHKFSLEETEKAFETTHAGKAIKAMIYCQK
jgi:Zn-dependent alcohol dehydrogenase